MLRQQVVIINAHVHLRGVETGSRTRFRNDSADGGLLRRKCAELKLLDIASALGAEQLSLLDNALGDGVEGVEHSFVDAPIDRRARRLHLNCAIARCSCCLKLGSARICYSSRATPAIGHPEQCGRGDEDKDRSDCSAREIGGCQDHLRCRHEHRDEIEECGQSNHD